MTDSLVVHEWLDADGEPRRVEVAPCEGGLAVRVDGAVSCLPLTVLESIMERYGKPLDDRVVPHGPRIELASGALISHRHRGFYDVIARDFVVWVQDGREPVAELATAVSAALVHFARALGER